MLCCVRSCTNMVCRTHLHIGDRMKIDVRPAYRILEFCKEFGIGRTQAYLEIHDAGNGSSLVYDAIERGAGGFDRVQATLTYFYGRGLVDGVAQTVCARPGDLASIDVALQHVVR